jgi:hypothetical protein
VSTLLHGGSHQRIAMVEVLSPEGSADELYLLIIIMKLFLLWT